MFCVKCGKEIRIEGRFCPNCGSPCGNNSRSESNVPIGSPNQNVYNNQISNGNSHSGTTMLIWADESGQKNDQDNLAGSTMSIWMNSPENQSENRPNYNNQINKGINWKKNNTVSSFSEAAGVHNTSKKNPEKKKSHTAIILIGIAVVLIAIAIVVIVILMNKDSEPEERTELGLNTDVENKSKSDAITSALTPTLKPTATPEPTATQAPTATPEPTATPSPIATPTTEITPEPTEAPKWLKYKEYDAKNRIIGLSASSTLAEKKFDHKVENIFSDDRDYCWCEGVNGNGAGEYIDIVFDDFIYLSVINIFNGYSKSQNSYNKNGKAKVLRISYESGYVDVKLNKLTWKNVKDNEFTDAIGFDEPIYTNFIRIEIRSVYKGTEYDDTCISKIGLIALGNKSDRKINTGYFN